MEDQEDNNVNNDITAIQLVSSQVDDTLIKVAFSNQVYKAHKLLADRIKKECERQKEIYSFYVDSNTKLEAEIKNAVQVNNSTRLMYNTISAQNIELKKELLLAIETKQQNLDRIKTGKRKYEKMWTQSVKRYESLPFVQKWLQANNKLKMLKDKSNALDNDTLTLTREIQKKKYALMILDRERIIESAKFIIHEMPKAIEIIGKKVNEINEITKEINILKQQKASANKELCARNSTAVSNEIPFATNQIDENWPKLYIPRDNYEPTIHLSTYDLEAVRFELLQVKTVERNVSPIQKNSCIMELDNDNEFKTNEEINADNFASNYYNKDNLYPDNTEPVVKNKKLINILEDIELDKNEVTNIINKLTPEGIKDVQLLCGKSINGSYNSAQGDGPSETDQREEIVIPTTDIGNDFVPPPPSQFLDKSQSQENKKRVSFDLETSHEIETSQNIENNDTLDMNSELEISTEVEDVSSNNNNVCEKHKLDSSPQFVYPKNNKLLKLNNDKIITSKFFGNQCTTNSTSEIEKDDLKVNNNDMDIKENDQAVEQNSNITKQDNATKEICEEAAKELQEIHSTEKPISRFSIKYGQQESLDISLETTGFEDGDSAYSHCIDNNLLLSPNAEVPISKSIDNPETILQNVPNFLTGLRKTGLSLFREMSPAETPTAVTDNSDTQQNKFNFNFSSGDKKSRGGVFKMFR